MTIEFGTDDLAADAPKMLAFLQGFTGGGGGPGTPPVGGEFFPADPGLAKFPSPEDSQIVVTNNTIGGRPYLKDKDGSIHTIEMNAEYGYPVYRKAGGWQGPERAMQCLVRQGEVYVQVEGGFWKKVEPNGTKYNANLPPAWTTPGGPPPTPPTMPDDPPKSAIAPGSSGRTIEVGPTRALKTLTEALPTAQAGDKIQLDPGTYTDTPKSWAVPLLIDLGGATLDATGKTATLAYGKGLLVPNADSIIQNGTITNTAMDQSVGQLTSAIRPESGCGHLTIKKMRLVNNQCGVGHGGFPIVITLEDCDISGNGLKVNSGSLTHNLYIGSECVRLVLTNVTSVGSNEAHAIKTRAKSLVVNGGTFMADNGSCFDIPNGTMIPFSITGATVIKPPGANDHHVMGYGEEGASNGTAGGTINGGSWKIDCDNPFIQTAGGTITATGVTFTGKKIIASGGGTLAGF